MAAPAPTLHDWATACARPGETAQQRFARMEAELIDYFHDAPWKKSILDRVYRAVCPRPWAVAFDAAQGGSHASLHSASPCTCPAAHHVRRACSVART